MKSSIRRVNWCRFPVAVQLRKVRQHRHKILLRLDRLRPELQLLAQSRVARALQIGAVFGLLESGLVAHLLQGRALLRLLQHRLVLEQAFLLLALRLIIGRLEQQRVGAQATVHRGLRLQDLSNAGVVLELGSDLPVLGRLLGRALRLRRRQDALSPRIELRAGLEVGLQLRLELAEVLRQRRLELVEVRLNLARRIVGVLLVLLILFLKVACRRAKRISKRFIKN